MLVPIAVALAVGLLGWSYQSLRPPAPKICGSPGGPPITGPRVKLSDGRHLSYKEVGVRKEDAAYKIIVCHGFASSKDLHLPIPQELIDELKIYLLFFDRAGYGESDPHPSRSVQSEAHDIEELADKLQLGSKIYVMGISMGGYPAYGCLKYIPHRLAGVALVVPFVHYWWPCLPANIARKGFKSLLHQDQWAFRVARYAPWLFYWWMTQKWFPSLSITSGNMAIFCPQDLEIMEKLSSEAPNTGENKIRQQGDHESLHRDIMVGYGTWGFDPLDLINPFPNDEGSVHIWQGQEDRIIPLPITRFIAEKVPWIRYHEVPNEGHLFISKKECCKAIIRALLLE